MKKMNQTIATLVKVLAVTMLVTFMSCKKEDEVKPIVEKEITDTTKTGGDGTGNGTDTTTTGGDGTGTMTKNTAPVINGSIELPKNGKININDFVTDTEKDSLKIVSITGVTNGEIKHVGDSIWFVPNETLYVGVQNISLTISDGKNTVTNNIKFQYGTTEQIKTYNIISRNFGVTFAGDPNNLVIKSNGMMVLNDPLQNGYIIFYTSSSKSASFIINPSGTITLNVEDNGTLFIEYIVTSEYKDTNNDGIMCEYITFSRIINGKLFKFEVYDINKEEIVNL